MAVGRLEGRFPLIVFTYAEPVKTIFEVNPSKVSMLCNLVPCRKMGLRVWVLRDRSQNKGVVSVLGRHK
jgi:hypothetical protein